MDSNVVMKQSFTKAKNEIILVRMCPKFCSKIVLNFENNNLFAKYNLSQFHYIL